jgi:hypothetical protein
VAAITFFLVLLVAGSNDVLAVVFGTRAELLRDLLRVLVIVLPVAAGLTFLACRWIARIDRTSGEG